MGIFQKRKMCNWRKFKWLAFFFYGEQKKSIKKRNGRFSEKKNV